MEPVLLPNAPSFTMKVPCKTIVSVAEEVSQLRDGPPGEGRGSAGLSFSFSHAYIKHVTNASANVCLIVFICHTIEFHQYIKTKTQLHANKLNVVMHLSSEG